MAQGFERCFAPLGSQRLVREQRVSVNGGDDAITYRRCAGEQAQARSANEEAIAYFRKAIALLATLPAAPQRDARELDLHLALGPSLMAARGYAHDETGAALERALSLAESVDSSLRLATALMGTGTFHQTRGNVPRALQHFERALPIVERAGDDALNLRPVPVP